MCGPNSIEVLFGVVNGKAGTKVLFQANPLTGEIGTSHQAIRDAFKLQSNRHLMNVNYADGAFSYENGTESWYTAKVQAKTERQIADIVDKKIPAYLKALVIAQQTHDLNLAKAQVAEDKKLEASKASAFAKLGAKAL